VDGKLTTKTQSCSWELGTRSHALLELNAPTYSVLSPQPLPPPPSIPLNLTDSTKTVISIAHTVVANHSIANGNITGPQLLMNDTSAADLQVLGWQFYLQAGRDNVNGLKMGWIMQGLGRIRWTMYSNVLRTRRMEPHRI
jgi:hypothetical protein